MSDNSSNNAVSFVLSLRDKLPAAMFPAVIVLAAISFDVMAPEAI